MNNWINIETKQITEDWSNFSVTLLRPVALKIQYIVDWNEWENGKYGKSFGLMRWYYPTALAVSPSWKIYPKEEIEIRSLSDVIYSEVVNVQIKKVGYYGNDPFINWSVSLEYEQSE